MAPTLRHPPKPPIIVTSLPTFSMEDLRLRADKLALAGDRDEAALLHALLDGYTGNVQKQVEELNEEVASLKEEVAEAEQARDEAEAKVDDLRATADQALEAMRDFKHGEVERLLRKISG